LIKFSQNIAVVFREIISKIHNIGPWSPWLARVKVNDARKEEMQPATDIFAILISFTSRVTTVLRLQPRCHGREGGGRTKWKRRQVLAMQFLYLAKFQSLPGQAKWLWQG
jgi:hypothetical protein